jgi:hypothetical protein
LGLGDLRSVKIIRWQKYLSREVKHVNDISQRIRFFAFFPLRNELESMLERMYSNFDKLLLDLSDLQISNSPRALVVTVTWLSFMSVWGKLLPLEVFSFSPSLNHRIHRQDIHLWDRNRA